VLYHDLSYLPYPFLGQHILLVAKRRPRNCTTSSRSLRHRAWQRTIGRRTLIQLQALELMQAAKAQDFPLLSSDLVGVWLPGIEEADPLLLVLRRGLPLLIGDEHRESLSSPQTLERARYELAALRNRLRGADSELARALYSARQSGTGRGELLQQAKRIHRSTPQPFRPKTRSTMSRGEIFSVGERSWCERSRRYWGTRQGLLDPLLDRGAAANFAIEDAPLSCGRRSAFSIDLQDNPIDSPASFFSALARRAGT